MRRLSASAPIFSFDTLLLFAVDQDGQRLRDDLEEFGYLVHLCAEVETAERVAASGSASAAVFLDSGAAKVSERFCGTRRRMCAPMPLIVIHGAAHDPRSAEWALGRRIAMMHAGADICLAAPVCAREISARLRAFNRRRRINAH